MASTIHQSLVAGAQIVAVEAVLKDLGVTDIPRITVWNKAGTHG